MGTRTLLSPEKSATVLCPGPSSLGGGAGGGAGGEKSRLVRRGVGCGGLRSPSQCGCGGRGFHCGEEWAGQVPRA